VAQVGTYPPCPAMLGGQIRTNAKTFLAGVGWEMEDGLGIEKHLTAANCQYISGFWVLCPHAPTVALPQDPAGGLLSPKPTVPTLTSEPGYATA